MRDAIRNLLARTSRPSVEGRRRRFVAGVLFSATAAGSIPVIAALQSEAISDVRGAPGTFWLSGEAKAQVVLAATGGELASLALATDLDAPAQFDVVDTGVQVLLHDRDEGTVIQIDGIEGKVGESWDGFAVPISDDPALVAAGSSVWLVGDREVTRFVVDLERNETTPETSVAVPQFDQWVGTSDGVLWLLDRPKGELTSVDAGRVTTTDFAKPGLDLVLSAIGDEPVVLDRTTGRLRWPRAAESVAIEGFSGSAVIQEPSSGGSCIVVLLPEIARCYDSGGEVRSMAVTVAIPDARVAQVFANEENLIVASPAGAPVAIGSWPGRNWVVAERPEPSGRPLIGHFTPGALMIDDPGSRFAITADRGEVIQLDKFNQRTVLLSADGVAAGAGVAAGEGGGDGAGDQVGVGDAVGDGQVFDDARGPDPRDDEAVTRVKRKKQIDVLANDFPKNAALAVKSVSVVDGTGTADVIDGTFVQFTPDGNLPGEAELIYTVTDAAGRTASAQVFIDIVGDDENTPPTLGKDNATVASGVSISVDVLANDTDDEGDPISVTRVIDPANGTASVNESGQITYRSDPSFVGSDTFIYEAKDGYDGGTAQTTVTIEVTPGTDDNRPPNPSPDRATVTAGRSVQVDVLANDSDPDGDGLRVLEATVPSSAGLSVSVLPSQQVSITAVPDARTSLVQVTYSIADTASPPNRVQSTIAVVILAATAENREPIAVNDSAVVTQNSPRVINLIGNDSDPDGDVLTITSLDLRDLDSSLGSVRQISPSSVEFTPGVGAVGATSFTYVVSDPNGASDTARVSVQVVPSSNSGPVARDDILTVFGGGAVNINVLANDSHPDGLALALGQPTFAAGLGVVVNPDQTITFTPPSSDPRTYSFTYVVRDSNGRTATAQVVVTIDRVTTRSTPVAANDQVTTVFGTPRVIDVLANDADPDGQTIDLVSVTTPSSGTATITATRQIRYTPPATFSGLANFSYTIRDADGNTATASVVVQVLPAAKVGPVARDDLASLSTRETREVDVLANDTDPDGANADLVLSTTINAPTGIGATVVGGKIRVVASGTAGSYVIPYTITDADALSASGRLTVLVTAPANQPPVAVADPASTEYRVPVMIPVLANDTDPEGGALTLASVTAPTDESSGAVAGATSRVGNSVRYEPGAYAGGTVSFSYVVSDDGGRTAVGNVRVAVTACSAAIPTPAADAVVAARGQTVVIPILGNDGPTEIASIALTEPSGGRARLTSTNTVEYTAPAAAGTYSFNYTVVNTCEVRGSVGVEVTVNRAPTAAPDTFTLEVGGPTTQLDVLKNDTDPDSDTLRITRVQPERAANIAANGRTISFKPAATPGVVSFTYTVADCSASGCVPANSSASVTINVVQPNRVPVTKPDTATMTQGQSSVLIDVLTNDSDPDNDPLILTNGFALINPTTGASLTKEGNSVRFTPANACATGAFVFTYWVTDGQGNDSGATGQVTVTIGAEPNVAPVANDDPNFATAFDTPLAIKVSDLLANDSDANTCDTLTPTFAPGSNGTILVSGGAVTFTPTPGFSGSAAFAYTLSDGRGLTSSPATVSITVAAAPTTTVPPTTTTTVAAAAVTTP